MDYKKIPKGLFALKKIPNVADQKELQFDVVADGTLNENSLLQNENVTVERFGFNSAKANNGSTVGLAICLNRIYLDHKKKIAEDNAKQAELKKPYRLKLHDVIAENEGLSKRKEKIKSEEISDRLNKIEILRKGIAEIKANPGAVTGDKSGRASFYIGSIILLLLTIYLFIFYSSASYSSFFKEFTITEITITNSIFDAQALSKAWKDGFTELILIVTIPAVFLGLGYLIHKSSEKKGVRKFLFISSLILVTFLFDTIIAYEICEKIYNIRKENTFQGVLPYSLKLAFQSINFWLIIFAGFVVYLIWGLVFDFTMESHEKLDKFRMAITAKEKEISVHELAIEQLNTEINKIEEKEQKNTAEINKLNELIDHTIIIPKELEQYLFHFMQGWLHWMSANLQNQTKQKECQDILSIFIDTNIRQIELKIAN
jgi:hypothetical protein